MAYAVIAFKFSAYYNGYMIDCLNPSQATSEDQANQFNDNSSQNTDKNQTNVSGKYFTPSSPETKPSTFTVGEIMGLKESIKNKNVVDDVSMKVNGENKQIPCPEEEQSAVKDSKVRYKNIFGLLPYLKSSECVFVIN